MSQRLAKSKRNGLIANFMEGKEDPKYEVIHTKTTKDKYSVRKRNVNLPIEIEEETPIEPKEKKKEEAPAEEEADPGNYFNPYNPYMFQEYQVMLNRMMVE